VPLLLAAAAAAGERRQFFREQYEQLQASLFGPNRAAFPAEAFSYDRFAWAVATVRSRLHAPLDADPVTLVPLADAVSEDADSVCVGIMGRGRVLRQL
jgi:hypothetical protein